MVSCVCMRGARGLELMVWMHVIVIAHFQPTEWPRAGAHGRVAKYFLVLMECQHVASLWFGCPQRLCCCPPALFVAIRVAHKGCFRCWPTKNAKKQLFQGLVDVLEAISSYPSAIGLYRWPP